jgi:polysaccharide export outer membrane protein
VKKIIILALTAVLLSSCAHKPALIGRPELTVERQQELPLPTRADLTSPGRPYVIGPFDRLSVEVFGLPELTRQVQADAGGHIAFPFAGSINAAGLTPQELSTLIASKISGYVRNPQVTVNVTDTVSNLVTVDGQVTEPGLYPVLGRMTLMRAIASAKGVGEFAKTSEVVLFRSVNGQQYAALYDLDAIRRGVYADPQIYANDVVVVGDSPARRLLHNLIQVAPVLTAPVVALIQHY